MKKGEIQMKLAIPVTALVLCLIGLPCVASETEPSGENCSFRNTPEDFIERAQRSRREVAARTARLQAQWRQAGKAAPAVPPGEIPRRNFIDAEIFDALALAQVQSAALSGDAEFLRRVYLDTTGRIPTPSEVVTFVSSTDPNKRDALIAQMLSSGEFVDKWTMWLGDLLANNATQSNISRGIAGRNAFHDWIRNSIGEGKPWRDIAFEAIAASGNSFDSPTGAVNSLLGGRAVMGPAQDIYDLMFAQTADCFLGLGHYDCLLCHDGRRHLDDLSLWGKTATRLEAYKMAAFFSRILVEQPRFADFYAGSFVLSDRATGNYALNTNFGNRPNRVRVGTVAAVDAEYRDGSKPGSPQWRPEFARKMIEDPMFSINIVNRLWKALFGYALVEPVNGLDPARLDPDNPPPAPWQLQASHPRLLRRLAKAFVDGDHNLRAIIELMLQSSAYQLSSRYDGGWSPAMVPLFARHYARRLDGEEIHDAIVKATGMPTPYTVGGWAAATPWALQLPEPIEPRSNGTSLNFMSAFLRGNRDTQQRSQASSILQQLNLMNDVTVLNRIRVASSPSIREIVSIADKPAAVDALFLLFLSRWPTEREKGVALSHLSGAGTQATQNAYFEDLAWALINMTEFAFSY
jgi:hypothetical protein